MPTNNNWPFTSQIVPRLKMDSLGNDSTSDEFSKIDRRSANRFLEESLLPILAKKSDESKRNGGKKQCFVDDSMDEQNLQSVHSAKAILCARFSPISTDENGGGESGSGKLPPKSPRTKSDDFQLDTDQLLGILLVRSKLILRRMSQRQNGYYYSYYDDQFSFGNCINNNFNSFSSPFLLRSSASNRSIKNGIDHKYRQHIAQNRTEFGRNSVPLLFYASNYDDHNQSKGGTSAASSLSTDSFRFQSVEKCPFPSQQQQQHHYHQQMHLAAAADRRLPSQQQIGQKGQNIGEDGRYRTEQLSFGEEAALMGGYWPSPTKRTTAPGGRGNGQGQKREIGQRTLKKGAGDGSSAVEEITAWFQRNSADENRSEQQPQKGKALEKFDDWWRGNTEKRTESDDGMGNEWQSKSSSAVFAVPTQLGHSIPNQYQSSTSLGTTGARRQRAGTESPSIKGTGGQAKIRRRVSLGSVEKQHTRGGRAVNNRGIYPSESAHGDFLQNNLPIKKDAIELNERHKLTTQNNRSLINRSKTLPSIKFEPEAQQKTHYLRADNLRNSNRYFVYKNNFRPENHQNFESTRIEKGGEKSSDYLGKKSSSRGEKELQEELEKLFEQLGLLDRKHLMGNKDFKNLFDSMRKQFDSPTKETAPRQKNQQSLGQEQQGFCFTTNGAQKTERRQNAYTKSREDNLLLGRSASNNSLAQRANGAKSKTTTATSTTLSNGQQQQRRQSLPQQQPKNGRNLENFWLSQMVKAREAETSSNKQRLPLGLSAAEKLQSIGQLTDGQRQKHRSMAEENHSIHFYPFRKYGGAIETVAMRRNNYLVEAARTASPSGTSTPTTNSGRVTPNFSSSRAFKSASPSVGDVPNSDFLDFGTPSTKDLSRDRENRKGCGRFPTVTEEERGEALEKPTNLSDGGTTGKIIIAINQSEKIGIGHLQKGQRQRTSRSPPTTEDNISECSQQSQCSAKPTTLPQPTPKHNLRDKLISAGFPINRQATSFFGGNAKNPFYGGQKQSDGQQQQEEQQQNSSAPNFPFTNTVISRVNLFEKQQQQQPSSVAALHFSHPSQHSSEGNRKHLDIVNGNTRGNGQLSPRSSVFRTKSVIVFDFDHLDGTPTKTTPKGETEEQKTKGDGKMKEQKPKQQQQEKGDNRKTTNRTNKTKKVEKNGGEKEAKKVQLKNKIKLKIKK